MENKGTFNYTYSAKEQEEIRRIRQKYEAPEKAKDKMEQLRRLDTAVTQKATVVSLIFGVIGCLIFGTGLSFVLEFDLLFWGIALSLVGGIFMALAYPFYNLSLRCGKKKYGAEILNLSQQLLDEQTEN